MVKPSTRQVFINCPFDSGYHRLFRATVFTIHDCGFIPRCALEFDDALKTRLHGIVDIIRECRYGIHDLSRVELDVTHSLPRFNMPFELGLFFGARYFGDQEQERKNCLVLDVERYRFQKFISDLSGSDIAGHGNDLKVLIVKVRDWLVTVSKTKSAIPDGKTVVSRYQSFERDLNSACKQVKRTCHDLPFVELTENMTDWIELNPI